MNGYSKFLIACAGASIPLSSGFVTVLPKSSSSLAVSFQTGAQPASFSPTTKIFMTDVEAEAAATDFGDAFEETSGGAAAGPQKTLADLEVGSKVTGRVRSIVPYGAFVDVGCDSDGLLHISQMDLGFVKDPNDVLSIGEEVEVYIREVKMDKGQISLGRFTDEEKAAARAAGGGGGGRGRGGQRKKPDIAKYATTDPQEILEGSVVSITDYGCFVNLSENTDGLVHISQMSLDHVDHPSDIVREGDLVEVRVISVDEDNSRISLSMLPYEEGRDRQQRSRNRGGGGGGGGRKDAIRNDYEAEPVYDGPDFEKREAARNSFKPQDDGEEENDDWKKYLDDFNTEE